MTLSSMSISGSQRQDNAQRATEDSGELLSETFGRPVQGANNYVGPAPSGFH